MSLLCEGAGTGNLRVQQLIQRLIHVFHAGGESDLDTARPGTTGTQVLLLSSPCE